NTPDFSSLPAPVFLLLVGESGSMLQVRYLSGGLLFLKPLGTFPTMLPPVSFVNGIVIEQSPFPQFSNAVESVS
ncbi:MAG TPA: hypothetical protein VLY24_27110, partial [Bryobacteraceae bacterium]|nr:hypothetical protein [Bryobacteraceae bacterium]